MDFFEIYDQYYDRVRKFILTLVRDDWMADDLIQDTFTRVREKIDTVKDPEKLSAWIHRIAYNLCQDHFRRRSRAHSNADKIPESVGILDHIPVQQGLEQNQMGECVQNQMSLLPESLRTVLVLNDVSEFSQKEIAEILGISVENVKVRLHRARKRFRAILEDKCNFERDERNVLVCEPRD